jgi:hypothetical protein
MSFRLLDQKPQYRLADGSLAAGGSLTFTTSGGSTAKSVYAESALSTDLGNVITLDSDARHSEDLFLAEDEEYRVQLKDADGVSIWVLDHVRAADSSVAVSLPSAADGTAGQVLATDGTPAGWYFTDLPAIPSQTGNNGKYLTTDGEALSWATPETYDSTNLPGGVAQGSTSFQIGKFLVQTGTGTVPTNTGAVTANVAVTFGTAYATLLGVQVTATGSAGSTPQGAIPTLSVVGSTSGFTCYAYAGDEHDDPPGWFLTSTTPFSYVAFGLVA